VTDHLGNNRVAVKADGTVIQTNHYYPFGTAFAENTVAEQGRQPYKYNGKELDAMHGLNWYDYSARHKDDWRFTTVDPLAEKYYSISPYAYCGNNPIKFIDKDGKAYDFPPIGINPSDYQRMATSQYVDHAIKANSSTIQKNGALSVASLTDVNDAVVLGTTVTRGSNAINVNGTSDGGVGIGFAVAGVLLPAVSGSAVKGALKAIGKALGIGGDAVKGANKVGDAANAMEKTTETIKTRPTRGGDGATSKHIIEKDANWNTISKTHQVTDKNGNIIHQHQDHVNQNRPAGEPAKFRQFPDEWIKYPKKDCNYSGIKKGSIIIEYYGMIIKFALWKG
jgi:RHS repeat-associated protein